MKLKVMKKQANSKDCFVCGRENEASLKASFFEMEDGSVVGLATARPIHQSYPFVVHGGVSTALLDETMGRAIMPLEDEMLGVTVEMCTRFHKPVPYDVPLVIPTRVTDKGGRIYTCEGSIILPDGTVAVTAVGKFYKMNSERLASMGAPSELIIFYSEPDDPVEIEIPEKV